MTTEEDICHDNTSDDSENEEDCNDDLIPSAPTSEEMQQALYVLRLDVQAYGDNFNDFHIFIDFNDHYYYYESYINSIINSNKRQT